MMNLAKGILTTLIDALEKAETEVSFFKEFKTVPSSYFDVTSKDGPQTIRSEIFHGHIVRDTNGRKVVVTETMINGEIHYFERSIFNTGTIDITDKIEEIIYSGSIENCWYKWYLYQQQH